MNANIRAAVPGDASTIAMLLGELGYPCAPRDIPHRLEAMPCTGRRFSKSLD